MQSELLTDTHAAQIVEDCLDRTGERLRSITYFTQNDFDQLYLRDDLERGADLASFIGLEWRESGITGDAYKNSELGEHRYTIRAFENGYLLRVGSGGDGIFITTDGLSMEGFEELAGILIDKIEALPGNSA